MDTFKFNSFVELIVNQLKYMNEIEKNSRFSRTTSPTEFEKLVIEASEKVIKAKGYECTIDYTEGSHAFPDVVYNFGDTKYGVEVKSSTSANLPNNTWTILGNSILGSTRIDVEDLYIIYVKVNKNGCFVNYARYEDSISDVVVTHSPRYKINLAQNPEDSFFARSGISYMQLNDSDDPISLVTTYFREQGETAWWIAESTPATIKTWNELDEITKKEILSKAYLLFPELIYSSGSMKYKRLAKWLVANYSVVDSSLRDRFTAGGRVDLKIGDIEFERLPRVYESFYSIKKEFKQQIVEMPLEELDKYWESYSPTVDDCSARLTYWMGIISEKLKENRDFQIELNFLNAVVAEID